MSLGCGGLLRERFGGSAQKKVLNIQGEGGVPITAPAHVSVDAFRVLLRAHAPVGRVSWRLERWPMAGACVGLFGLRRGCGFV